MKKDRHVRRAFPSCHEDASKSKTIKKKEKEEEETFPFLPAAVAMIVIENMFVSRNSRLGSESTEETGDIADDCLADIRRTGSPRVVQTVATLRRMQ